MQNTVLVLMNADISSHMQRILHSVDSVTSESGLTESRAMRQLRPAVQLQSSSPALNQLLLQRQRRCQTHHVAAQTHRL